MFIKKNINDFTILFDSSGSIYITELSILLMSDLHIGKSYSCAKNGNFLPIINWLKKNIHSHGNYYKIDELLLNVTGEKLNLKYFEKHIIDRYLKEKK